MRRRHIVAGVVALILGAILFLWAFTPVWPALIAKRHQHFAQAICDFRAENGVLPDDLQELVPRYLSEAPPDSSVIYANGVLTIDTGPHTYISYSFRGPDEGWQSASFFDVSPLPVAKVTRSVVPVAGDDLIRARIATYDRRIKASSKNNRHYTDKISYMISLGRREDAYAECLSAASAHPDWWRPQMGLATLAPRPEVTAAEARFRSWVEQHPAFIHYWYLAQFYRDLRRKKDAIAALRQGANYPLEDVDSDAAWVPHAFAFDAARFACKEKEPELVLAITDMWSSPRGTYNYASPDLPAFRAAALLALGRISEARVEADRVLSTSRERRIWAGNLEQLDAAIRREDLSFVYDSGPICCGSDWSLFPAPE